MSEDLKDVLEEKHKEEAKDIPVIEELPAGSNKGKKAWWPTSPGAAVPGK